MPVNDAEPRYRLVDANDNIIGSVYAEADGTLKLQEGSGSNNEAVLGPDGTLSVPAVSTDEATTGSQSYGDNVSETISGGEITYQQTYMRVEAESNDVDTLDTITGGDVGDIAILEPANDDITLSDGVGNIETRRGDVTLTSVSDKFVLINRGVEWNLIAGSY